MDETKIELARSEASAAGVENVGYEQLDIRADDVDDVFDVVYARFLLTHLSEPAAALETFRRGLRRGGTVAVEDIDFTGYFTYPESKAFKRYHELYCATVATRGGDPDIGPRLPRLIQRSGFIDIRVSIAQPVALEGEAKLITPITMETIADVVLQDGLATRDEVDALVDELYDFAADPTTLAGMPRVIQVSGRLPT